MCFFFFPPSLPSPVSSWLSFCFLTPCRQQERRNPSDAALLAWASSLSSALGGYPVVSLGTGWRLASLLILTSEIFEPRAADVNFESRCIEPQREGRTSRRKAGRNVKLRDQIHWVNPISWWLFFSFSVTSERKGDWMGAGCSPQCLPRQKLAVWLLQEPFMRRVTVTLLILCFVASVINARSLN